MRAFHENPDRLHVLTLKAHNHKMNVFCRVLKYLKPHRQTVCTTMFASMPMVNGHFQMQLFCWRFKDNHLANMALWLKPAGALNFEL